MLKHFISVVLIIGLSAMAAGQSCDVTHLINIPGTNMYWPQFIFDSGNWLYVSGTNFIGSVNNSIPTGPYLAGGTTNYSYTCGDNGAVATVADMFPGDSVLFLATLCHGIHSYETNNNKINPAAKAYVELDNAKAIAGLKIGSQRYLVLPTGTGMLYANFTDLGSGSTVKPLETTAALSGPSVDQLQGFESGGKVYLAMHSRLKGFKLWDVTNFPTSATLLIENSSLKSFHGHYHNNRFYVTSMSPTNYGLFVYSLPTGTLLGQYTGRGKTEWSDVRSLYADDQYAYLALGDCAVTGGLDIVDISTPSAMFSILPAGFELTPCESTVGFDTYATAGTGAIYMFLAGHTTQDVYKIVCGQHANIVLQGASPASVDPGGTYPLTVTLQNTGNLAATGVNATLSTTHAKVSVNVPTTQSFGTMNSGASASKTYTITVAPDATASSVPFHLDITAATGSYSADFTMQINPPRPILNRTIRKTVTGGALEVQYANSGNADYTGTFSVTLTPSTTGVSLTPSMQTFGPIAKGATQTKTYSYTVGAGACSTLNFISVNVANSDPTIGNTPADVSVDLIGTDGAYPFLTKYATSLSKAGEIYTLSMTVKNVGTAAAQTVQVSLASPDAIWSTDNVLQFGDIAAGASVTQNKSFTVSVGTTEATFTPAVTSVQGCWSWAAFSHSMLDIKLTHPSYANDDWCTWATTICMTQNSIFEGTESGPNYYKFLIGLTNTGSSDATAVAATLEEIVDNAYVTLDPGYDQTTYTIPAGATGQNAAPFKVSISKGFCTGSSCPPLQLRLTVPGYLTQDLQFTVLSSGGTTTYSISGAVSGAITSGVTMTLSGAGTGNQTTGSGGSYTFGGLANGSYTVTPSKSGYTFSPTTLDVTIAGANQTGKNFTATSSGPTYSISGTITVSGAGLSGVRVTAGSASAYTTSTGAYTISGLSAGDYTVTPTLSGYTFSPTSTPVTITSANRTGINFTGTAAVISLSYQRYTVDDPAPGGDGDKILEPGESALLYVTLKNDSSPTITSAEGTLTTSDAGVTINAPKPLYTVQQFKEDTQPFSITLSGSYAKATISFSMTVAGVSQIKNLPFTVAVGGGATITLSYQRYDVDDGDAGDGILQPGESVKLNVYLRNDSASAIASASARLSTAAAGVSIKSQGSYTLQPNETNYASFNLTLSETYAENTIPFEISVTGALAVTGSPFSVPVGSAGGSALVIPVVAHIQGANDTNWKTDVNIHNDSATPITLTLKLIRTGMANDNPPAVPFELAGNQTLLFGDVLANPLLPAFQGNTLGSLLVEFTGGVPPSVTTRIYNDLGVAGTYGQSAPAILVDSRTRGTSGTVPSKLFGLRKTSQYRTNLGLVNITAQWNTLQIDLLDAAGNRLGEPVIQTLAPYNMIQLNDILGIAGVSSPSDAFMARVTSNSSQDFVAYASIADGITGDASYISDQIAAHGHTIVPGVGHTQGAENSNWKTDLAIFNPDDSNAVTVRLTYFRYGFEGGGAMVRIGPIPPLGSRMLDDVLTEFAGLSESEAGFLVVEPENQVDELPLVAARTYNYFIDPQKGPSTFGQYIPGADYTAGGHNGQTMMITGLSANDRFRLNIGLINADEDGEALATISMYDATGARLGVSYAYYLPYKTMGLQFSTQEILSALQIGKSFENGTLVVQVGGDNLFVYASSVDNATNDPVYLEPLIH